MNHPTWQIISARSVSWWEVHSFVKPMLASVISWPLVGIPAWVALPDDDPVKWASLLDAAQHWALRVELAQEANAAASQAISAIEDWSARARDIRERQEWIAAHPWARLVTP